MTFSRRTEAGGGCGSVHTKRTCAERHTCTQARIRACVYTSVRAQACIYLSLLQPFKTLLFDIDLHQSAPARCGMACIIGRKTTVPYHAVPRVYTKVNTLPHPPSPTHTFKTHTHSNPTHVRAFVRSHLEATRRLRIRTP